MTRLLALVSAPPLEAATVRHVEVLLLQPTVAMVVVITSTGGVSKRIFTTSEPLDAGLVGWAAEYLNESVGGVQLGTRLLRARFDDPGLSQREGAFLALVRPAFVELEQEEQQLFVGGAAGHAGRAARGRARGVPARAAAPRTTRCGARGDRSLSALAADVRPRRRRVRGPRAQGRRARRGGLRPPHPHARLGLACSGRSGWTTRRRSARSARRRSSCRGSSKGSSRTTDRGATLSSACRRRSATTTSCSASRVAPTRREIKRAFRQKARELHPDVSDAPDAEVRFREVVEAYEVLSKSETRELYDRFGHAGLRGGSFNASQFDFGSLTDLFSAFFGDDLFGARRPAAARAWTRRRRGGRDRARRSCDGRHPGCPVRGRRRVRALRR